MKFKGLTASTFVPSDIQRVVAKIKLTWTKLTDADISCYLDGDREKLLAVLQAKYNFSKEQAETALSSIERLA